MPLLRLQICLRGCGKISLIRTFIRILTWCLASLAIYFIAAFIGALVPSSGADITQGETRNREIILARGGIHYDILLPLDDDTRIQFGFLSQTRLPLHSGEWLSVGWGSEAFYTSTGTYTDIALGAVFKAVTLDRSVFRFEVYGALPDHPDLHRVPISDAQLNALRASIYNDLDMITIPIETEGFSETDVFFAAQGAFHLLQTCNVWVGQKMRAAGFDFGVWTPTPYAVTIAAHVNSVSPP